MLEFTFGARTFVIVTDNLQYFQILTTAKQIPAITTERASISMVTTAVYVLRGIPAKSATQVSFSFGNTCVCLHA